MKKLIILPIAVTALAFNASAADLTAPDAAFNWTAASAWDGGTTTWNSATPDSALFGAIAADRTVTLNDAITADDITFSNTANRWTVSGSGSPVITLDGTITKNGAGSVTLSRLLGGAGGIEVNAGEFRMTGLAHTFSGGITLNSGGTLFLPVGFANGSQTSNEQTSGVFGTGTLTLNGGTMYFEQGNTRFQYINAVIGGNFASNSVGGGGVTLGNTTGTRTVSIGGSSRTITVSQNSDGTGANSFLAFQSLTNSAGGAIVKNGEGLLRIQGSGFNGGVTINAGTVEISDVIGAASYVVNSGAFLRKTTNGANAAGGSLTMNSGTLILNTTSVPGNARSAQFATLQVSGTSNVYVGSGLTIQSSGSTTTGINVRSGGVIGGNGLLRTAATQGYLDGVNSVSDFTDSAITLSAGGQFRPGTPDSLNSTIGDLSFGSLTWNGEATSVAQMAFNLSGASSSDQLSLSGALTKGTDSNFVFDFLNTGAAGGTYSLLDFASQTGFSVTDFSFANLGAGLTALNAGGFTNGFKLDGTTLQFATVVPEPTTWALLAGSLTALMVFRRRRQS